MPELPDVEGFRSLVERHLVGAVIVTVRVLDAGVLRNVGPADLAAALDGVGLCRARGGRGSGSGWRPTVRVWSCTSV